MKALAASGLVALLCGVASRPSRPFRAPRHSGELSAGVMIIEAGDNPENCFFIINGKYEAFTAMDGERVALRTFGAREMIGIAGLLTGRPSSVDVVALETIRVKRSTRDPLDRELEANDWLGVPS